MVRTLPANAGDVASIPESGRSPGEGHGNPLQYSSLEKPMDKGAWRAAVHSITKSQTRLKGLSTHILSDTVLVDVGMMLLSKPIDL